MLSNNDKLNKNADYSDNLARLFSQSLECERNFTGCNLNLNMI